MMKLSTSLNRGMLLCALILALLTFQSIPVSAVDEGMWTFNNVPRETIKQKYGFEVTDDWLKKSSACLSALSQWLGLIRLA